MSAGWVKVPTRKFPKAVCNSSLFTFFFLLSLSGTHVVEFPCDFYYKYPEESAVLLYKELLLVIWRIGEKIKTGNTEFVNSFFFSFLFVNFIFVLYILPLLRVGDSGLAASSCSLCLIHRPSAWCSMCFVGRATYSLLLGSAGFSHKGFYIVLKKI